MRIREECHMQVHLSRNYVPAVKPLPNHTSPPSTAATFLATHSQGGAATLQVFRLPWQRYSYSTQSSMMELLLSVSQH